MVPVARDTPAEVNVGEHRDAGFVQQTFAQRLRIGATGHAARLGDVGPCIERAAWDRTLDARHFVQQSHDEVSLDTFRGQPFVLTFVFTRCPVPNFCPRMSNNFEELQAAIKAASGSVAKTRLLSVTLDPDYDTPKVLNDYAAFHHADPKIWSFATGDEKEIDSLTRAFSVYRQNEGGTISHGLATALINPNGTVERIWRGNAWTPAEVIEAVRSETK